MSASDCLALILAAGKGKRMYSDCPKVLLRILDQPLLSYLYMTLEEDFAGRIWTVIGHGADMVREHFVDRPELSSCFIIQEQPLGTGHAVLCAWPEITKQGKEWLLILNGDTPLVNSAHLRLLLESAQKEKADMAFLSLALPDPGAFGRVLRREGQVEAVIEAKEYDPAKHGKDPCEINAGIYCLRISSIGSLLAAISNDNAAGEYYLTDVISLAVGAGKKVIAVNLGNEPALLGLNTVKELAEAEERLRNELIDRWLEKGVLIRSVDQVRIGPEVYLEPGVEITGPCEIYGKSQLEHGVVVMANTYIRDAELRAGCLIKPFSHLENCLVNPSCLVGPFARVRPGTVLEEGSMVGNFVELKKSRLGRGSKASHLTYLCDAEIGPEVNIGAGTITCNYDGRTKHKTVIEAGAFIGSNTALIAPVTVGEKALVGAGSVITRDVPADHLGLSRGKQINRPRKQCLD